MRNISKRPRSRHGMVLLGTMLVIFAIMTFILIGVMTSSGTSNGMQGNHNGMAASVYMANTSASVRLSSVAAFNMAEAGVDYTINWLSDQASAPSAATSFGPATPITAGARTVVYPDPTNPNAYFSVKIYPDESNQNNEQKKYLIESIGVSGGSRQIVQVYVGESSLSRYLVLNDKWPTVPTNYWVQGISTFDGPVHDNNSDGAAENVYWNSSSTTNPLWTYNGSDAYEVGTPSNWYNNTFTAGPAPTSTPTNQWGSIFSDGQDHYTPNAANVPFPTDTGHEKTAALGQGHSVPTSTGVTVSPNGGIYIHCVNSVATSGSNVGQIVNNTTNQAAANGQPNNDVQQMTLSVDSSTHNQIITVKQTGDNGLTLTTTITLDAANNQTLVTTDSQQATGPDTITHTTVTGLTNGVIYCDGNIGNAAGDSDPNSAASAHDTKSGGLSGVVADNYYNNGVMTHQSNLNIVTDLSNNKNCYIDGNITYNTARQKTNGAYVPESQDTNFTKNAGTLGIVSNTILIMRNLKDSNGNPISNLETDGAYLANNLFDVDQYNTRGAAQWEHMGSYLSRNMGIFGMFDGGGNLIQGMNNSFNYDIRMRNTPPPFFPTNSSQYLVISWRRVNSTLE